jgi:hypothetical protein
LVSRIEKYICEQILTEFHSLKQRKIKKNIIPQKDLDYNIYSLIWMLFRNDDTDDWMFPEKELERNFAWNILNEYTKYHNVEEAAFAKHFVENGKLYQEDFQTLVQH